MLEDGWMEAYEFLEGIPVGKLLPEGCVGQVWSQGIEEDAEEVSADCTAAAAKEIRRDSKKTASGRVGKTVACWK
jgi:hypothetical protein